MKETSDSGALPLYMDPCAALEARVEDALRRLTLDEKVALCHAQSKFSSPGVARLGIPELWMSDGPHGVRAEINWNDWAYAGHTNDAITAFPALTALAATWNRHLAAQYGACLAEEALYRRKDVILGPGLNIYRTPMNGRNFEYLGEDPFLAGEMAVPYIRAMQERGVAACVKHFALNNQEKWRGNVEVKLSDRALYEIYLPAFRKAVEEGGAWAVMGAYNKIWGEHCCHNRRLLCDILRGEWAFDGAVITDWGGAHDTREAALNGLDIEMGSFTDGLSAEAGCTYDSYYLARPYLEMMRRGELPEATVDGKARNILRLIFRTAMNTHRPFGCIASESHYEVARRIAGEAIVLLKNNGVLPLRPERYGRILVVGENATKRLNEGGGSSELKAKDMFSPLDALREVYGDAVSYAEGYRTGAFEYAREHPVPQPVMDSLHRRAVEMAREADVVIYIGGLNKNAFQDCESTDRYEYNLPWGQDSLIEDLATACPNVIVANISGNAYAMPWLGKVGAVIQSWYLGTMTGPAMADVISGAVNPSGKLPFTFPADIADNCAAHFGEATYPGIEGNTAGTAAADLKGADVSAGNDPVVEYREDILVGYRWHDTMNIKPLFPFGYGLSYTTFAYSGAKASAAVMAPDGAIEITVRVTNTGGVAGKEVVQLYTAEMAPRLPRPAKELRGFGKVELLPGETKEVRFTLKASEIGYFDPELHAWRTDAGSYEAYIAASAADIRATVPFEVSEA